MVSIKLPAKENLRTVLIADDEPEHLDWLIDYIKAKGFDVVVVTNVNDAIVKSGETKFLAYVIDLNIPLGGWQPSLLQAGSAYEDYNGLYIIKVVRSQGVAGSNVIAYSAHYNELITTEIKRLYCGYIVKGRPRELKVKIDQLLKT